ncbi:hypothetical protein [Leeuwenhoekiella marinoflava]|uniref:Uncharacterized protein n=2 Tax=Leeuwenhoekiella marinoflava TaxID=988 RepID=A0A4Q0PIX8_9FLAO|nr:hypothetical protein [Leeuwenhoekiella marinoflava]RXG27204.1 hypothetical protein DSL99_2996 [Leeuwenhoekiella marinoflava]SHF78605.1 hypothetical protein SAMN02745246_03392 [Leeuwenhoekiella marinoflava DSM 3653]
MKSDKENKNNQFNVPQGYFESFDERLMTELKFQQLFPEKSDGFTVPENYFDQVEKTIIELSKPQGKLVNYNFKTITGTAAAIAAVLLVLFSVVNPIDKEMEFDSLSITSLESYFEDEDRLQDYFSSEELNTIQNNTSIFDDQVVTDDIIYEYVDQEIIQSSLNDH